MEIDGYLALTDKEAVFFYGDGLVRHDVDSKYHAGLSVMHGLHCLDAVRMHLDKGHYLKRGGLHQGGPGYPANFTRTHMCKSRSWPVRSSAEMGSALS
jgi:hypothetical protein